MSGFLHRLASQVIGGRDSSLRSVVRLPYAIPPSAVYNEEADRQVATLGTMGSKRHPIASSGVELDHMPGKNQPPDSKQVETGAQAFENKGMPASPEVLITQPVTGFTTKPELEIVHPSSEKSRPQQAEKNVRKTADDESLVWNEAIKTRIPLSNSAIKSIANGTLTDSTIPAPLLPLKNTAQPSVLSLGAVAQRGESGASAWKSQVEETTEVHVSIGRIEVTAMHETSPPKRQAPAAAKPMTLDEYLARRRREA